MKLLWHTYLILYIGLEHTQILHAVCYFSAFIWCIHISYFVLYRLEKTRLVLRFVCLFFFFTHCSFNVRSLYFKLHNLFLNISTLFGSSFNFPNQYFHVVRTKCHNCFPYFHILQIKFHSFPANISHVQIKIHSCSSIFHFFISTISAFVSDNLIEI